MPNAVDAAAAWLARRSLATRLLLGGAAAAIAGYQFVELGSRDPGSLVAYVGAALLLVGQLGVVAGAVGVAWLLLAE
ncbi:hypothetical protein [Halobaculum sp. D14]|uniref:hypothetical protein n=1 Tax=Halobaculum sp. D14 TaxID=3421642 RepID=UPI003EB7D784